MGTHDGRMKNLFEAFPSIPVVSPDTGVLSIPVVEAVQDVVAVRAEAACLLEARMSCFDLNL